MSDTKWMKVQIAVGEEIVVGVKNWNELRSRLAEAEALLKEIEWITDQETGLEQCHFCKAYLHRGHFDDCRLAAFLKGKE